MNEDICLLCLETCVSQWTELNRLIPFAINKLQRLRDMQQVADKQILTLPGEFDKNSLSCLKPFWYVFGPFSEHVVLNMLASDWSIMDPEESELQNDYRYRSYASVIEKALRNFESSSEWADLISSLGKLNKVRYDAQRWPHASETFQLSLDMCSHAAFWCWTSFVSIFLRASVSQLQLCFSSL